LIPASALEKLAEHRQGPPASHNTHKMASLLPLISHTNRPL
jgi:hypothetical protein